MTSEWLTTSVAELWLIPLSGTLVLASAIVLVRLSGLRALSKMSSFDFLVTVALGSIIASVVATSTSLINGVLAFASLLLVQAVIARLRRSTAFGSIFDNEPRLLMTGSVMDERALTECRITRHDVLAKLREANVTRLDQVLAVVLESTGDISVLHGSGELEAKLLEGVRSNG